MSTILGLFGCFTPLLLLVLMAGVYVYLPGWRAPTVDELVRHARKYQRKRPGAKQDEIRSALVGRFTPPLEDEQSPLGSGVLLGVGGVLGVRFAHWLKRLRHDQTKVVVAGRVEQALAKLANDV